MSITQIQNDPAYIVKRLSEIDKDYETVDSFFDIEGESLEQICRLHPKYYFRYKAYFNELGVYEKYFNTHLEKKYGELYKQYNEKNGVALSSSDIKAYINGTDEYVEAKELLLKVAFIRNKISAVVDSLEAMGYTLNNITKIKVADLENTIIL